MSLLPRLPASFGPYRHEMGPFFNLFNDTFSELQKLSDGASRTFAPKFDVKEAKDNYTLEGELPGIEQKDIVIEFADEQTITVKGRTERTREEGTRPAAIEGDVNSKDEPEQASSGTEMATTGPNEVAKHDPQHTYWVSERSVGEFARSFSFPNPVDHDNVKASMKNGILSIVVPKMQKAKSQRRVHISSE